MSTIARFEIGGQFLQVLTQRVQEAAHCKYRPDFPLTFSAASDDYIWSFPGFGYSKLEHRCQIEHPFLRAVVREYKFIDENLGRFHVCEEGVFKGEEKRSKDMFIVLERGLRFSDQWKILHSRVQQANAERLAFIRNRSL